MRFILMPKEFLVSKESKPLRDKTLQVPNEAVSDRVNIYEQKKSSFIKGR